MTELEQDAEDLLRAGFDVANAMSSNPALYSIAISLKRIADILHGQQKPVIMTAEEYTGYKASLENDGNVRY